jgi:hypothetical protein
VLSFLGPLVGLVQLWFEHRAKAAERADRVAEARATAEINRAQSAQDFEQAWDLEGARQMAGSWKDEWYVILLSVPLILAFCGNWGNEIVFSGFNALDAMPLWYKAAVGVAIGASFGYRKIVDLITRRDK